MPKLDIIHNAVKGALIKDGWTITDDPFIIEYKKTKLYADLGAERPIAAERGGLRTSIFTCLRRLSPTGSSMWL